MAAQPGSDSPIASATAFIVEAVPKVTVESAEYWDSPSSKLVQLTGFVKAVITGEPYKPSEPAEHGRVDLSH
jgi:hypothetical protein